MLTLEMQDLQVDKMVRAGGLIGDPDRWALFIDIDGTLLEVAPTPDAVSMPPGLVQTLERVERRFSGAVALITGRRVSGADRLFAPLKLVTSGVHGTEVRAVAGAGLRMLTPPVPSDLVREVSRVIEISPGIMVEQKGAGVAVHYRNAPETRAALETALEHIVGRWREFQLRPGRKVLEVLPRGSSKGSALVWLMRMPQFRGRLPIMIGDDWGDEPALAAAAKMGGAGLRVAGEHFDSAVADFASVASVRAWLSALADRPTARDIAP